METVAGLGHDIFVLPGENFECTIERFPFPTLKGMYICGAEREQDKTYVSSRVSQGVKTSKPVVELISCMDHKARDKLSSRNNRRKQRLSPGEYRRGEGRHRGGTHLLCGPQD